MKRDHTALLGMPVWSASAGYPFRSLSLCLRLDPRYNNFRRELHQALILSSTSDKEVRAALEVLRPGTKMKNRVRNEVGDGVGAPAANHVWNMAEDAAQSRTMDDSIESLVENAIGEAGFIPRDVHHGVYYTLVAQGRNTWATSPPPVYPFGFVSYLDCWGIDFKSAWIARRMVE